VVFGGQVKNRAGSKFSKRKTKNRDWMPGRITEISFAALPDRTGVRGGWIRTRLAVPPGLCGMFTSRSVSQSACDPKENTWKKEHPTIRSLRP